MRNDTKRAFGPRNSMGVQSPMLRPPTTEVATMSKDRDRTIYQRPDGKWVNKRNDAEKATGVHDRQADAIKQAKGNLTNQGGGELTVKGRDGKFRSKDTIPPGNDPNPPKDTEH